MTSVGRLTQSLWMPCVLAKKILSWVTHAKRPLIATELQHGLGVLEGLAELDEDFIPEVEDLISVCAGLVFITLHKNI